eukprot:scaffold85_cov358-Pavlova_lutheri.AAC.36
MSCPGTGLRLCPARPHRSTDSLGYNHVVVPHPRWGTLARIHSRVFTRRVSHAPRSSPYDPPRAGRGRTWD